MDVLDPVFLFVVVKFASNGILFSVDGVLKGIAPVAVSLNRFHNAITFKLLFISRSSFVPNSTTKVRLIFEKTKI